MVKNAKEWTDVCGGLVCQIDSMPSSDVKKNILGNSPGLYHIHFEDYFILKDFPRKSRDERQNNKQTNHGRESVGILIKNCHEDCILLEDLPRKRRDERQNMQGNHDRDSV